MSEHTCCQMREMPYDWTIQAYVCELCGHRVYDLPNPKEPAPKTFLQISQWEAGTKEQETLAAPLVERSAEQYREDSGILWLFGGEREADNDTVYYFAECYAKSIAAPLESQVAKLTGERDRQYEFNAGQIAKVAALESQVAELTQERDAAKRKREHTWAWYAAHYGKLEDWARTRLPDPWRDEFFNCVANGTWGHADVGEPYISAVGRIVPSGYFKMETAAEQLLFDQKKRAEDAEDSLQSAQQTIRDQASTIVKLREALQDSLDYHEGKWFGGLGKAKSQWRAVLAGVALASDTPKETTSGVKI